MLDFLIISCRAPIALLATIFICMCYFIGFIVETAFAIILLPIVALNKNRAWLEKNWPGTYPLTLRQLFSEDEAEYDQIETPWIARQFGAEQYRKVLKKNAGGMRVLKNLWKWAFTPTSEWDKLA